MVQATSAELVPEHLSGQLVVPALNAKASVGQLAYEALRKAILAMDVYHSDADLRLDEKTLAADLGVSRTPVREALARLEHEGLVRILPRRGVYIVRKSKAEIIEMITVWAALEARDRDLAERLVRDHALNLADHVQRTVDHLD